MRSYSKVLVTILFAILLIGCNGTPDIEGGSWYTPRIDDGGIRKMYADKDSIFAPFHIARTVYDTPIYFLPVRLKIINILDTIVTCFREDTQDTVTVSKQWLVSWCSPTKKGITPGMTEEEVMSQFPNPNIGTDERVYSPILKDQNEPMMPEYTSLWGFMTQKDSIRVTLRWVQERVLIRSIYNWNLIEGIREEPRRALFEGESLEYLLQFSTRDFILNRKPVSTIYLKESRLQLSPDTLTNEYYFWWPNYSQIRKQFQSYGYFMQFKDGTSGRVWLVRDRQLDNSFIEPINDALKPMYYAVFFNTETKKVIRTDWIVK